MSAIISASTHSVAKRIKVLIVDDSALVRKILTKLLEADRRIEVVGSAPDPYIARDKIKQLKPDVLTLDVEMPKMDGITFLKNLMRLHPMPVIMVSSLTERGALVTLESLEVGTVDFVSKPKIDVANTLEHYGEELIEKVMMAAKARVREYRGPMTSAVEGQGHAVVDERLTTDAVLPGSTAKVLKTTDQILAIGASTGGTEAIRDVLVRLPADTPGTVITQHIPPVFSKSFAERLDQLCAMHVSEASDGQVIQNGCAYVAPGDRHLMLVRDGARYVCRLSDGPPVNRHKPSVDVLFRSVAQNAGHNAIGVILTGMGDDGANGLLELRESGASTIAQDEQTSVVWGMPGQAVKRGAAGKVLPLDRISDQIMRLRR